MLVLPEHVAKEQHNSARQGLIDQFNKRMEEILNRNSATDTYWILGKVKFPDELGGRVAHVFLEACAQKPPLVAESFLYEVDNRKGQKTLLWVMHPDKTLVLPTLRKSLSLGGAKKKGR